jgi:hypothetical protein
VAELIALGMVTTVGMIESEMGHRTANPFITQQFFPYFYLLMQLLQFEALFKKYCLGYLPLGP